MPVRATGRDSANGSADAGALVPPAADGELAALWAPLLHAATADAATQAGREPDPAAVLELCRAATLRILELNDQAWNAVEFAIQNAALDGETVGTLAPRVRAILTETYRTNAPDIVMRELGAIADAVRALPDIPAADRRNGHSLSEVLA
jgi:hypothetical protein